MRNQMKQKYQQFYNEFASPSITSFPYRCMSRKIEEFALPLPPHSHDPNAPSAPPLFQTSKASGLSPYRGAAKVTEVSGHYIRSVVGSLMR